MFTATTTSAALVGHLPTDVDVLTYRLDPGLATICRANDILRRVKRDRVDFIHLTSPGPLAVVALFVAQRLNVPVLASLSADFASTPKRRPPERRSWSWRRAVRVSACRMPAEWSAGAAWM